MGEDKPQNALDAFWESVGDKEKKYIIGKIHAVDSINQELSNLLEPKEPKNDDDKVTRIRK
jgi:hypothetical protein